MKRKVYLIILLCMTALFPASVLSQENRAEQTIYIRIADDATTAINNGDFERGEKLLIQAMQLQPESPMNPLLLSNLGMCRYYMGEDSLAIATLNEAVAKAPASVTILLNRAKVKMGTGNLKGAMTDYNHVNELDSLVPEPYFYRGFNSLNLGDYAAAAADFDKLGRIAPDSYESCLAMATLYSSTGEERKAIPFYNKLINKEKATEFLVGRAYCYLKTKDLYSAAEDIAEGLRQSPEDGDLYLCRAILNRMRYLDEEARADAEKAIKLGVDPEKVKALMK